MESQKLPKILDKARMYFQKIDVTSLEDCQISDISKFTHPPVKKDCSSSIRIVIISDTHGTKKIPDIVPDGDILIHCGDFTRHGRLNEVESFNAILGSIKQKFQHILVIAGNHELTFDPLLHREKSLNAKRILDNCIYLEDSGIELLGIKFYGTPWHPRHRSGDAFPVDCGKECLSKWAKIPDDTDVLMTHTPPYGLNDRTKYAKHAGCSELLYFVKKIIKPRIHAFGHIHEAYGMSNDGNTTFVNASICDQRYRSDNLPVVIDY